MHQQMRDVNQQEKALFKRVIDRLHCRGNGSELLC
jgi:hypothetical protein